MADPRSVTALDKIVAIRISEARKQGGLSQADLGDLLGVSFQQLRKYEPGTNRIPLVRLIALAQATATPLSTFLDGLEPAAQTRPSEDDIYSFLAVNAEALSLIKHYRAIRSPKLRRKAVQLVALLAKVEEPA